MGLVGWAEKVTWYDWVQDAKNRFYNLTSDEKNEVLDIARIRDARRRGDMPGGEREGGAR